MGYSYKVIARLSKNLIRWGAEVLCWGGNLLSEQVFLGCRSDTHWHAIKQMVCPQAKRPLRRTLLLRTPCFFCCQTAISTGGQEGHPGINYLLHQMLEKDTLKTLAGDLSNRSNGTDRCVAYRSHQQPRFFHDQLSVSFPLMIKSRPTGNRFVSSPAFDGNSSVPADWSRNMSHVLKRAFTGWA